VATVSMATGLAVMLLSVAIVVGFKKEVSNKVIGFGSHIQIVNLTGNGSYDTRPVAVNDTLYDFLRSFPEIIHIEQFATKPGMLKTDDNSQAMIFKGVDENYDWTFFQHNLVEGRIPKITADSASLEVLVSNLIAKKLNLKTDDSFIAYFINSAERQSDVRLRKFKISGIYNTGFSDYDKIYILSDIKHIRRLNQWDKDMATGLELRVKHYGRLDKTAENLYYDIQNLRDRNGNAFFVRSIKQLNPPLFAWLDVLDMNVWIILALMLLVAGFSMISGLLIIILERANMIGILKTLGQNNTDLRKIFLYVAAYLTVRGMVWGNLLALAVCFLQKYTGFLKLNPDVYYLTEVPMEINVWHILLINVGVFSATILFLTVPSWLVANISPAKTVRFE
jgi:lipoprotein-releasing system permease protein